MMFVELDQFIEFIVESTQKEKNTPHQNPRMSLILFPILDGILLSRIGNSNGLAFKLTNTVFSQKISRMSFMNHVRISVAARTRFNILNFCQSPAMNAVNSAVVVTLVVVYLS